MRILPALFLALAVSTPAHAHLAELLVTDAGLKKPIELTTADVTAELDQAAAKVTYDLTFVSPRGRNLEGTFYFALPRGSYVHEFGMWVDGHYQGSAIVEAKAGRVAYESIVRRGLDPALLEWTAGNTFKMRVFPIVAKKPTRIKLTIGLPLDAVDGKLQGAFPLDLGKVEDFELALKGRAYATHLPRVIGLKGLKLDETDKDDGMLSFKGKFAEQDYLPPDELRVEVDESDKDELKIRREDGDERFVEARVFPKLAAKDRAKAGKAVVYWDYSLSEEEHKEARLEALRAYLAARKPQTVDLYGFNQKVFPVKTGLKGDDVKAIEAELKRFPYDGGTRLDVLADALKGSAGKAGDPTLDLVLLTNGVDSFEVFDFKRVSGFDRTGLNAFMIVPANGGNDALIERFAHALGAVVLDQDAPLTKTSFNSLPWTITKVEGSKSLRDLELPPNRQIFEGGGVIVRGQVKKDGDAELKLTFAQDGKQKTLPYKLDTDVKTGKSGTVPRLWAMQRVNRLLGEKRKHQTEITQIALEHQLMSPYTVMVVLEWCEDYAEFKLDAPKDCRSRPHMEFAVEDDVMEDAAEGGESAKSETSVDFDAADIGGQRKTPMGEAPAASMPPPAPKMPPRPAGDGDFAEDAAADEETAAEDGYFGDEEEYYDEYGGSYDVVDKDSQSRPYGFEKVLAEKSKAGATALYQQYLATRKPFAKIPFYYIYTAELFARQKQYDLADLVLSNVVEVRPGDARWLRIYAYSLIAWGRAKDSVPLYRAIAELREEDPQSFRDFGLAMEAIGQPVAAMRLFEKVYAGKWDSRLEGMSRIIQHDLTRAARASLETAGLTPENQQKAQKYATVDAARDDKIVVTVSWDTDMTDIDLHVVEPGGAHVFFGNMKPEGAGGQLSYDTTQGFGPEQYRNPKPFKGHYRVYLRYFSQSPVVVQDGTFARVDVKLVQGGVERQFVKTVFLKDQEEVRTVLEFDYNEPGAPQPPLNFKTGLAQAKEQLKNKQAKQALATLTALGDRHKPREQAQRFFHMARAHLALGQYDQAEQLNSRAVALDPSMLAAHFNNACALSLAKNRQKAILHLNMLADALINRPRQRSHYMQMMSSDADLTFVRGGKDFNAVVDRIRVGH